MSRLEGTKRHGADHRQPRVSLLQLGPRPEASIGPVQGRRPGRLLSPGGRAGQQAARPGTQRGGYPGGAERRAAQRAWSSGCQGERPASSQPRVRTCASATSTWPRYPRRVAADEEQRRGAWRAEARLRRQGPPGRGAGTLEAQGGAPATRPHPRCLSARPPATDYGPRASGGRCGGVAGPPSSAARRSGR